MNVFGMDLSSNDLWLLSAASICLAWLIPHWLSSTRDKNNRRAADALSFRARIQAAIADIPAPAAHWENTVLNSLPDVSVNIQYAVSEFAPFTMRNRTSFLREWEALKHHFNEDLPKALSPAEKLYGGGPGAAQAAKEKFHNHVCKLLAFATGT